MAYFDSARGNSAEIKRMRAAPGTLHWSILRNVEIFESIQFGAMMGQSTDTDKGNPTVIPQVDDFSWSYIKSVQNQRYLVGKGMTPPEIIEAIIANPGGVDIPTPFLLDNQNMLWGRDALNGLGICTFDSSGKLMLQFLSQASNIPLFTQEDMGNAVRFRLNGTNSYLALTASDAIGTSTAKDGSTAFFLTPVSS